MKMGLQNKKSAPKFHVCDLSYLAAVNTRPFTPILPGGPSLQPTVPTRGLLSWGEGSPEAGALLLSHRGGGRGRGRGQEKLVLALVGVDVQRQEVERLLVLSQLPLVVGGCNTALGVTTDAPLDIGKKCIKGGHRSNSILPLMHSDLKLEVNKIRGEILLCR